MVKVPWYEKQGFALPMPKILADTARMDTVLIFSRLAILALTISAILVVWMMRGITAAAVVLAMTVPLLYWLVSPKSIFGVAGKRDTLRREIEIASPFSVWCEEKGFEVTEYSDEKSLIEWFDKYNDDPYWNE